MARTVTLAVAVLTALLVAAAALLWWWTLPPAAAAGDLAAAAARAPADAEGLVVLAAPSRLGRWLARRRQAAALLILADPRGRRAVDRLEPVTLACARAARGPLLLWWRGEEAAIQVEADPGGRHALAQLAALKGLVAGVEGDTVTVADSAEGLGPPGGRTVPGATGRHAGLALVAGRWWWIDVARRRLVATSGEGASPPELKGPSVAVTAAAAPLLGAGAHEVEGRIALLVAGDGWGVSLPGVAPSPLLRRLFGERRGAAAGAVHRMNGPFGEVWIAVDGSVALASRRDLLDRVRALDGEGDHGAVRGADLARALDEVAIVVGDVPGMRRQERELRRGATLLRGLASACWRLGDRGGTIIMEW